MTLLVGVSLSMDAFSLALIYGMQKISKKDIIILSAIVGLYHFFMPLFGVLLGNAVVDYFPFDINILVSIIFIIIGLEMCFSSLKDKEEKLLFGIYQFLIFGFSVSIDSFTTGIGLNFINNNYFQVSTIFCLVSGFFTFLGLFLGDKLKKYFGKLSTIIGGIVLVVLGFYYFFV